MNYWLTRGLQERMYEYAIAEAYRRKMYQGTIDEVMNEFGRQDYTAKPILARKKNWGSTTEEIHGPEWEVWIDSKDIGRTPDVSVRRW